MSSQNVITKCHHRMSSQNVITECHHRMSSHNVIRECHHRMSPENVTRECHQKMSCLLTNRSRSGDLLGFGKFGENLLNEIAKHNGKTQNTVKHDCKIQ